MSKFLVTGAAGFIGLNMCQYLLGEGHTVLGVDNFSTSCFAVYKPVLKQFKDRYPGSFTLECLDLSSRYFIKALALKFRPDYVIHLAAIPSVARSVEDPFKSIQNNVISTTNIALAAIEADVKKLVYAGSSSYYGGLSDYSYAENEADKRFSLCKSPYAASKAAGEMIVKAFHYTHKLPVVVLRFFNVFGPYQNSNSQYSAVIPAFIRTLLNNEPPVIYGNGTQSRDFTFIKNIIHANLLACTSGISGKTFDVGCGDSISLLELLAKIQKIMGTDKRPEFLPRRLGDVDFSQAVIWDTHCSLGYSPVVSIDEGLEETVRYYTKNKNLLFER